MRTKFSPFRFVLGALCALSLLGLPAYGQRFERDMERATEHPNANVHHDGVVQDWSQHHTLYPRFGPIHRLIALQHDPRALQSWQHSFREDYRREFWRRERSRHWGRNRTITHKDWSVSLGVAGMAPNMYPSKWTFDSNETITGSADTGSCLTDYIVFTVNTPGGLGQPNIVGLNNLYSGNAGASGIGVCNRAPSGTDDGLSATTLFSYDVHGDDGVVATSPTTSLDGTKIAFVEGTTTAAHFHVLAWKSGDGNNNLVSRQDVTNALTIAAFNPDAPAAGSGTATDFALGAITTLSSPFVEYSNDVAYVGDDAGVLYKFKDVFCTTTACTSAVPNPAPSLDTTWGGTGSVIVCAGTLTGAIADGASGNIFVGCSDGNLYGFTPTGTPITGSPLIVGNGTAIGGLVDPPVLDEVNGFVYVETGSSAGTSTPVVVQASVNNLGTNSVATIGANQIFNLHAPAFNDAYFTNPGTPSSWLLYEYSSDSVAGSITLWGIGFAGLHVMTPGTPADSLSFPLGGSFEISPLTEFLTTGGEDRVFASAQGTFAGNLVDFNVTAGFPAALENFGSEGTGTTGMVIDNAATGVGTGQANSIYFGVLGAAGPNIDSAVKLTQVDLQ